MPFWVSGRKTGSEGIMGLWNVESNQITISPDRNKLNKIGWHLVDETGMTETWSKEDNTFIIRRAKTTDDAIVYGNLSEIKKALALIRFNL